MFRIHLFLVAAFISLSFPVNGLSAAKLDIHLKRLTDSQQNQFTIKELARTYKNKSGDTMIHVFIEGDPATIPALSALGVTINTVTSSGIMTAMAPLNKINAITKINGIRYIEASKSVKAFMDDSTGTAGVNLPDTSYPRAENTGTGVIIGVIDSGIDIEHADFLDSSGQTRIVSIWDHTLDDTDVSGAAAAPSGFSYGTEWSQAQIQGGYATCDHRDSNGHGTHVAGTASGAGYAGGYASNYLGIAPEAELLIVKFDFDNEKSRNTETAILDGINWIFQKAAAQGKMAVINMSLGSDYGPHDGSTSEERGINDLTGPGKIVVVAAGNAGAEYGGPGFETFGAPIHGAGNFSIDNDIVLDTGVYTPESSFADYMFWDVWYEGSDSVQVQITAPNGSKYPPNFNGRNRNLWKTNGMAGGYNTSQGFIYVANGNATSTGWDTDNGDNNIYIEISDAYDTEPAAGQWKIEFISLSGTGNYHAWHGTSRTLRKTYLWYDSGIASHSYGDTTDPYLSDSVMTIGKPASAANVISVGAYQTKNEWAARNYSDPTDPYSSYSLITQAYGVVPIDYYTPFVMDDLASFSSRGPSRDGNIQPFISAPGVGIVASFSQTVLYDPNDTYFRYLNRVEHDGNHAVLQGTSMSSPHVAGVTALLLEKAQSLSLTPTPDDIKSYISLGARTDAFTGAVPNNDWGNGKVDATSSLAQIQAIPLAITTTGLNNGRVGTGYSDSVLVTGGIPPYSWAVTSGTLPDGLSIDISTGEISGTPTTDEIQTFDVAVTDQDSTVTSAVLSIQIDPASVAPTITSVTPDSANPGDRLNITILGNNFANGALVSMGPAIVIKSVTYISATELSVSINIKRKAVSSDVDITVTNPDASTATLPSAFSIL